MLTICRSAKGGSGTTTLVALVALRDPEPTLVVDLDGDLRLALGVASDGRPGVVEWLRSDAPLEHLDDLLVDVDEVTWLLPASADDVAVDVRTATSGSDITRWMQLASWCRSWATRHQGDVFIDAPLLRPTQGDASGNPPREFVVACDRRWLVTRRCYLGAQRACGVSDGHDHTGLVVVDEPGRCLSGADLERALGAPIIATLPWDPSVARAVDCGMALARRPPRPVARAINRLLRAGDQRPDPIDAVAS